VNFGKPLIKKNLKKVEGILKGDLKFHVIGYQVNDLGVSTRIIEGSYKKLKEVVNW